MKQYLHLLNEVYSVGGWKDPSRKGMPKTKELFGKSLRFNLQDGFPLLTTKKMHFKGIVGELLWFLRGDTNIKYLVDNNINIWNDDAYKYYLRKGGKLSKKEWLNSIVQFNTVLWDKDTEMNLGECGNIYGYQWRNFQNIIDQISNLIKNIKINPNSRYHVVSAWNPIDFIHTNRASLPACHVIFQINVRENKYLDLSILQRSTDTFLGLPYNIASYALLNHIISKECGYEPGELIWFGNSVHIYENHFDAVKEQLTREPLELCKLEFDYKPNLNYQIEDFKLINYKSHLSIKAPLSVGI